MKKVLLTIGMIVKNEEKYLEQCLTAIKPILENVDCELIIADTGSTDRTVEIAQKFTDNVFYFEWIKDFAAARNSTLEKAKGEWYMFLDADEIFKSCGEIIYFFNSGEYKKYNSASYIVRNYIKSDGDKQRYSDFVAPRLAKIRPETVFVNPVHEYLSTYGSPIKVINDIADHYGYYYSDDNSEDEKFLRNSELLIKRYEEDVKTGLLYLQLYECYANHDWETANKYLEEGIEFCKLTKDITLATLYDRKACKLYDLKEYDRVLEVCDEYFAMDKSIRPGVIGTDTEISAVMAMSLLRVDRYEEAAAEFVRYFDLFKLLISGKLYTDETFSGALDVATENYFLVYLINMCQACMKSGKYNLASEYLKTLPIAKYSFDYDSIRGVALCALDIAEHFEYKDTDKYYRQFNDYGKTIFCNILRNRIFNSNEPLKLINAYASLNSSDKVISAAAEIYSDYFEGRDIDINKLYSLAEKVNVNDYPEILYILIDRNMDISRFLKLENCNIRLCVNLCYRCLPKFHSKIENYSIENITDYTVLPVAAKLFLYALKSAIYIKFAGGIFGSRNLDKLFELYASAGVKYIEACGGEELPEDIKEALFADRVVNFRKAKKYRECIAEMKNMIVAYPEAAPVISEYQKLVVSEYERNRPKTELEQLADAVKSNIRSYISMGNMAAALHTLNEYKKINPSDPEIPELMKLIY